MLENRVGAYYEFGINRPLTDAEQAFHLDQKTPTSFKPRFELSLIKINSTFIEVVDVYYQWKGLMSVIALTLIIIFGCIMIAIARLAVKETDPTMIAVGVFIIVGSLISILFLHKLLRRESFRHTHYPVRLDRKHRRVHVVRTDGKTESVPWDDVFFAKSADPNLPGVTAGIVGHLLEPDRQTVRYSFALGTQSETENGLMGQWEFFRTYMEESPKDLIDQVTFCMPIGDHRESYFTGLERLMANFGTGRILMLPFMLWISIGRWFAMHTSKIPTWPKEIEDMCAVDPNDPYAKDYRINPEDLR